MGGGLSHTLMAHTDGDQGTYMPKGVQVVVGELQFLEGDKLPHPVCSSCRGIWVHIEAAGHGRFGFAGNGPG